jgi:hypothetical protein
LAPPSAGLNDLTDAWGFCTSWGLDLPAASPRIAAIAAMLFDTLRVSRTLRDKGHFTLEHAEALAEALGGATQGDFATKSDLAEVKLDLKNDNDIGASQTEIAETKTDILKWVIGAIGFQTIVILGALVTLAKIFAK